MSFEGKVLIVTGAAGGIGKEVVNKYLAAGGRVVASDLDQTRLEEKFGPSYDNLLNLACDVTSEAEVEALVAAALEKFGRIDGLFNSAGIVGVYAPIEDYPTDMYHQVINASVTGTFHMMKHAIPHMKGNGGAIVNAASTAGVQGSAMLPAYSAAKHAVVGLTRSAALVHAANNIRINAICPAPTLTDMVKVIQDGMGDGDMTAGEAALQARIPAGRYGEPHEVADLVMFLLSDQAGFVNGSMYTIDGAMTPF